MSATATELARRAQALNTRRTAEFGGSELELVGNDRVRTEHNCVPRDLVQVGGLMLFGYNVHFGLKQTTEIRDVFALHRHHDGRFEEVGADALPGLLDDPRFARDFTDLYRYYREAELLQLRRTGSLLLAVFQTGERLTDLRVLRWRVHPDGTPEYVDAKGERDHTFPPSHDFEWTVTGREDHVLGRHPHISIEGRVFVETVGGTLTVKIENNTESGEGVYTEPVDEPLQSLADAEVAHARVGPLTLLRILPYNETTHRYLVFNERSREVVRLDGIGLSCQRLPEDQGIIFPGGYYLTTAPAGSAARTFDTDTADLEFESAIRSPNGEDVLYVFHARAEGRTLLLPYNLIRKEVATPIPSHGYSLFEDGVMAVFRAQSDEPTRVHPMQLWQTPYLSDARAAAQPEGTGPLARIGNAELVRGISDVLSVARMAGDADPGGAVFEAIVAACTRVADTYYWLDADGLEALHEPLAELCDAAEQVIDEFERVEQLRRQAAAAVAEAA
ncbi:DNA repair ATPase, partial [Streptomyces sparsus]